MTSFLPAAERDEAYRRTRAAFLAPSIQAIVVVVVAAVAQSERPSPSSVHEYHATISLLSVMHVRVRLDVQGHRERFIWLLYATLT